MIGWLTPRPRRNPSPVKPPRLKLTDMLAGKHAGDPRKIEYYIGDER